MSLNVMAKVPECDGQPTMQVEPSPINRMVTVSTGVQTSVKSGSLLM